MVNLEKILKFQEIDIKLRKTLDEIDRSDMSKKMEQARQAFNTARNAASDSEKNAEEIVEYYKAAMGAFAAVSSKIERCESILFSDAEIEEKKNAVSELESLRNELGDLEKKLNEKKSKGDKVLDEYRDGQKQGKRMREIYASSKESLESLKKEKEPFIAQLKKQLDDMRPEIDAELLKQYEELASERKLPAYVEAYGDEKTSFSCRGCGLQLSQSSKGKLIDKGICRCDTCRRVIFIGEKKKK